MQPDPLREAQEWLIRAERDLLVAQRALQGPTILGEAAVYHAQQAAEKALKAFLAAHNRALRRTHDLVELVTECEALDPAFARLLNAARVLTPYAVRFRYPGGPLEPSVAEARQALEFAQEIVSVVRQQLGLGGTP